MHITKKSIFRKLSIISLAVLVFVSSLLGSTASTVNAVGVDTVVKLVGGKAVVRALAEKTGMALSKKQIDNAAGYIEKKTYDGDPKFIEFANKANAITSSGDGSKPGFKKYLLDPAMWLLGLDVLFLVADAFQDGYEGSTPVEQFAKCMPAPTDYVGVNFTNAKWFLEYDSEGSHYVLTTTQPVEIRDRPNWSNTMVLASAVPYTFYVYKRSTTDGTYSQTSTGSSTNYGYHADKPHAITLAKDRTFITSGYDYERVCGKVPIAEDVIDVTNVSNTVINNFDNDTYNTNTTYQIEIEMPDVVNYDDPTPWNEIDPEIEKQVDPTPPDTDQDGVPDETDSDLDKGGFLENILPIITLIAIFDLLKAVIFYLARMFEFILTIPLIEAIPIDNVAFEWFRTAEIVGIEIYTVISLLATIGLSFAVYKVVRRLLP